MRIKKIIIENFRGIKRPLILDFKKGNNYSSVALYGRNGNGKSSIVDSWEWLYSNKIEHLAREGAAAKEFPHKSSNGEDCYIEAEFDLEDLTVLRQQYDRNRITQPIIRGDHDKFKSIVKHPCHLRYRDLQTFVYFKKAERYSYLAKYLGFEAQLTVQDNLSTCKNRLKQKELEFSRIFNSAKSKISELILDYDESQNSDNQIINFINQICDDHSLSHINKTNELKDVEESLKEIIKKDPKTEELTHWKGIQSKITQFRKVLNLEATYNIANQSFRELKKNEASISKLLILNLYKVGLELIKEGENICPLCSNSFKGDLKKHVSAKHEELYSLKAEKAKFDKNKQNLVNEINSITKSLDQLLVPQIKDAEFQVFFSNIQLIKSELTIILEGLSRRLSEMGSFPTLSSSLTSKIEQLNTDYEEVSKIINENIERIEQDEARQKLADNFDRLSKIIVAYKDYLISKESVVYVSKVKSEFEFILTNYIDWVKEKIQSSFDLISTNVVEYFKILESSNPNISNPYITLVSDKAKAVELEIEFASEKVKPAFKVLSESQINSFGLAVFLAAIRQFNTDFKFVILDDVVNSFDSYKRPKVIELLNKHFQDFQFLILTHDQIWFDKLQRTFKKWNRLKFSGWDYVTGPKVQIGKNIFEEIDSNLEDDKPVQAGQILGRYLEWVLQELNQNFETPMKYKFDNQYTLNELFESFKTRIGKKLKMNHELYIKLNDFSSDSIFRNYSAHWKGSDFTSLEIKEIFEKWKFIESLLYCEKCNVYAKYDGNRNEVKCNCQEMNLKDTKHYPQSVGK